MDHTAHTVFLKKTEAALLRFPFALYCAGDFLVDKSNQDSCKSGTLMLGTLNPGNLEPQNPGKVDLWNLGTLKICNLAVLET